ncbi:hypothetical protein TNCV_2148861 [Trichonephila clavipes]|nr:hypothetical protein TNCV_2148861 [Trichonephila clavipes]
MKIASCTSCHKLLTSALYKYYFQTSYDNLTTQITIPPMVNFGISSKVMDLFELLLSKNVSREQSEVGGLSSHSLGIVWRMRKSEIRFLLTSLSNDCIHP